jgi:spore maturation protein SpmA/spore maturation protein SpmB
MSVAFLGIVLVAFVTAAWRQMQWAGDGMSPMESLSRAVIDSAGGAVELALGLIGVMTLFLGLMKVAEAGGLLRIVASLIRPLMVRLFPEVPARHPAMGAMILNLSANAMGLGNAATPFGIRAMQELNKINPRQGTATDSMALFLAINTSSITLLPTGVIALRASAGSGDPAGILPTTLFATLCSTAVAVIAAKAYGRFYRDRLGEVDEAVLKVGENRAEKEQAEVTENFSEACPLWVSLSAIGVLIGMIPLALIHGKTISPWIIPCLMAGFLAFGVVRRVKVYEVFVEGAKEGFHVAVRIIPYLVAILVAVGMFRASGALEYVVDGLGPWTGRVGLPAEALPMALMRPLSGSGAYGILASIIQDPAVGPDSYTGYLVSTLQGSTETTFYVLAVYFGAVQVRRIRHTLVTALTADVFAVIAAVAACTYLFR